MNKKKDIGFKLPEHYFEEFEQRIPGIIKVQQNETQRKITLSIYYAVAASIVLLIVSVFTLLPFNNQNISPLTHELSDVEYYDINMDDIYYAYNENTDVSILAKEEADDEAMIDYLASDSDLDELILLSE